MADNTFQEKVREKEALELAIEVKEWLLADKKGTRCFWYSYLLRQGKSPRLILDWKGKSEEVQRVHDEIRLIQEERIATGTAIGSPQMSTFVLKNLCGWSERQSTELTGKNGEPLTIKVIDFSKDSAAKPSQKPSPPSKQPIKRGRPPRKPVV